MRRDTRPNFSAVNTSRVPYAAETQLFMATFEAFAITVAAGHAGTESA